MTDTDLMAAAGPAASTAAGGGTADDSPRLARYLAHGMAFGAVFALAKILCVIAVGARWVALPWMLGADLLAGLLVALPVLVSRRLARILADILLVIYILNIHYAMLFGGFIDTGVLRFSEEIPQMTGSFLAVVRWWLLACVPLLMLSHRLIARSLNTPFAALQPRALVGVIAGYGLIVVGFWAPADLSAQREWRENPVGTFVASLIVPPRHRSRPGERPPGALEDPLNFDPSSRFSSQPAQPPQVNRQPGRDFNLVILLLESTGNRSRQRAGAQTMPNFQRLAEQGVYWPNFYAITPLSIKAIFALHTGYYPAADFTPVTETRPRFPCTTLAEYFQRRGYRTALLHGGHFDYTRKLAFLKDRGYDVLYDATSIPGNRDFQHTAWGVDDKAVFDYAASSIDQSEQPFLVTLIPIPILPHHPYKTPRRWKKQFPESGDLDRYHNSIFFEDQLLGDLMDHLKDAGRFQDTIFVVLGDHGEAFDRHPRNRIHSAELYEENVSVPLVISNPILFPEPQQCRTLGAQMDILPSLGDVFGLGLEAYRGDGVSLFGVVPERMVFMHTAMRETVLALRDGVFKFILRPDRLVAELYDLSSDPFEQTNLATAYPERVGFYRRKVLEWQDYTIQSINLTVAPSGSVRSIDLTELPIAFTAQGFGKLSVNETIKGRTFKVGGVEYRCSGFGTHANSIISFNISDYVGYRLLTRFGRDQEELSLRQGRAVAQIWVDGEVVYESRLLTSEDPPVSISVPLTGGHLSLVALVGDDGGNGDHVDWLEPRLVSGGASPGFTGDSSGPQRGSPPS